tara:strand:+ start:196 stop:609 length:414 start_codon:yes stop_codon:yes gene_type:complete
MGVDKMKIKNVFWTSKNIGFNGWYSLYKGYSKKQLSENFEKIQGLLVDHRQRRRRLFDIHTLTGLLGLVGIGFIFMSFPQLQDSLAENSFDIYAFFIGAFLITVCFLFEKKYKDETQYYEAQLEALNRLLLEKHEGN